MDVASDEARRFVYPALDLSVLAVPHQALMGGTRPSLRPEGDERRRVLVLHGEIEGVFPFDRSAAEYGGAVLGLRSWRRTEWSYVALGHYHVQHQVAPRVWYAGSLEYVSPNLWASWWTRRTMAPTARAGSSPTWIAGRRSGDRAPGPGDPRPRAARGRRDPGRGGRRGHRAARGGRPGGVADKVVRLRVQHSAPCGAGAGPRGHPRAQGDGAPFSPGSAPTRDPPRSSATGAPGRRQTLPELVQSLPRAPPAAGRARPRGVRPPRRGARRQRRAGPRPADADPPAPPRQFSPARAHRAGARRGPHRHRRAQRRREDDHPRGHRLGDVRHAGGAGQSGDHPAARRAASLPGGGGDGVQSRRAPVPHGPHAERRGAVPGR